MKFFSWRKTAFTNDLAVHRSSIEHFFVAISGWKSVGYLGCVRVTSGISIMCVRPCAIGMRGVKSNASELHLRNDQLFLCWKNDSRTVIAGSLFFHFTSMMLLLVLSLCCIIEHSFGYNLETELPVIRRGDAGSYFGFSVASHSFEAFDTKQNQSW